MEALLIALLGFMFMAPAPFPRRKLLIVTASLLALGALFLPAVRDQIRNFDFWTADWRTLLLADRVPGEYPEIALVLIDQETIDALAPQAPSGSVPRDLSTRIVDAVNAGKPAIIGLDYYFTKATEPLKDQRLIEAIQRVPSIVVGAANEGSDELSASELAFQKAFLARIDRPAGYINLRHDSDDAVRRTSPPVVPTGYPESFAARIANSFPNAHIAAKASSDSVRIAWLIGSEGTWLTWAARVTKLGLFSSLGLDAKIPRPSLAASPFLKISARDLVPGSGTYNSELTKKIKDKVVLISVNLPYMDKHRTPLSLGNQGDIGVTVHAQIIAQYLDNRQFIELSGSGSNILLVLLAAAGFVTSAKLHGRRSYLWDQTAATIALVICDGIVYSEFRLILPLTLALYTWLISIAGGERVPVLLDWGRQRLASFRTLQS